MQIKKALLRVRTAAGTPVRTDQGKDECIMRGDANQWLKLSRWKMETADLYGQIVKAKEAAVAASMNSHANTILTGDTFKWG